MIIKNGMLLDGSFRFTNSDIAFGKTITDIRKGIPGDDRTIDAANCYIIPGLVDTHMHAAMGETFIDFHEGTAETICSFEAANGTTSLVPAISAAPEQKMAKACEYIEKKSHDLGNGYAKLMGVHLEGPFFSQKYKGAHLPENIRIPSSDEFDRLYEASKHFIKIITMAPELENGFDVVRHIANAGVSVSVGHSNASYDEAKHAFECGACRTTHTFNAMSPLNHRNPGVVGAAMISSDISCELICDFFHVHPDVVKLLCSIKGPDKIIMITDSEIGAGMPDGSYTVNGREIIIKDKKTYTSDGTIAGGSTVLLDGVKNLVSIGIALPEAVKAASFNAAAGAGIADRIGSLEPGKDADILVLNKDLSIRHVFVNGEEIAI